MTSNVHIFPGFAHETSLKGDWRTLCKTYTAVVAIIIYRTLSSRWTSSPIEIYRGHFDFSINRVRKSDNFKSFLTQKCAHNDDIIMVWFGHTFRLVCVNTMLRVYNINEAFRNLIIYRYYKYMSHARTK